MRTRIKTIELKNVSHRFESGSPLIENVSFIPQIGKLYVFEGEPGCGKSLFLKIAAGLIDPLEGVVEYNGVVIRDLSFEMLTSLRMSTATSFDNGGLLMNKTLLENMKLPLLFHRQWRSDRSQKLFGELVDSFQLEKFLHLRPASVPVSIRKITGLARAFLSNPQVIFFDDPSLGLGEQGSKTLKCWIEKFRKEGKGDELVLMANSDQRFIEQLEDKEMILIKDNSLVAKRLVAQQMNQKAAV